MLRKRTSRRYGSGRNTHSDSSGAEPDIASLSVVHAASSSLSYDTLSNQYTYVLTTEKTWSGCRRLDVKLADGQTYTAMFKFSK